MPVNNKSEGVIPLNLYNYSCHTLRKVKWWLLWVLNFLYENGWWNKYRNIHGVQSGYFLKLFEKLINKQTDSRRFFSSVITSAQLFSPHSSQLQSWSYLFLTFVQLISPFFSHLYSYSLLTYHICPALIPQTSHMHSYLFSPCSLRLVSSVLLGMKLDYCQQIFYSTFLSVLYKLWTKEKTWHTFAINFY